MNLTNPPTHTTEVSDPDEYTEAVEAAETLGLELREVVVRGAWEGRNDAEPGRGSPWDVHPRTEDARKWFCLTDGRNDPFQARPRRSNVEAVEDGTLQLQFD